MAKRRTPNGPDSSRPSLPPPRVTLPRRARGSTPPDHDVSEAARLLACLELPIIRVGRDRRIRELTPAAATLLGLSAGDVGRRLEKRSDPVAGAIEPMVSEVLDRLVPGEREVLAGDGRWYRMEVRPYWTAESRVDGAVVSLVDVDAYHRARAEADGALERATAMLDAVGVPLLVVDDRPAIRSANRAFTAAFGGGADLIGAGWFEIDGGAWDRPVLRGAIADLLAGKSELAFDVDLEVPRGCPRTVALAGRALGGQPPAALLTLVDVTERTELVRAAENANRTKDVFLATLSHELRVPLHTITLQSDLLLTGGAPGPAKARRVATAISLAAKTQEQIINDLLDVSAILAGKMQLVRQPVDLAAVVGAAVSGVRQSAAAKQIRLRASLDRSAALVIGDPTRLQQVAANLLGNAIKFTPSGGQVAVALRRSPGGVEIEVSDNGQGIAPEALPHVFERFVQEQNLSASGYGGLGLGLAIVRDLVRMHRGSVRAESAGPGQGATFTVELPGGARATAPPPVSSPAPADDELKGIRVLIVEDDPSSREVLTDILRFRAAEVLAVPSAAEVMDAIAAFRPDVMLCDVAMPGEDGYSLMRRVRALDPDRGGRIPAVALTALATKRDRRRALSAGFHMHIAKPTPAADLCRAVRKAYRLAHPDD